MASHADMNIPAPKTFLVLIVSDYIGKKEATSVLPALLGALYGSRCPLLAFKNIDKFSDTLAYKCLWPKSWRNRISPPPF